MRGNETVPFWARIWLRTGNATLCEKEKGESICVIAGGANVETGPRAVF